MMKIKIKKTKKSRLNETDFDHLEFGEQFSDHMFIAEYANGKWNDPRIIPFGKLSFLPSLTVLHYGQAVFEGLKAYLTADGGVNLFRAEKNHERLNTSCERLCIPPVPLDLFTEALEKLVAVDRAWIPNKRGNSLYIRPFVFATDDYIGVRVSRTYAFIIFTSPVGAYYKEGLNPVKLITSGGYARAVIGGLGEVKTPANYAASLLPAEEAKKKGFTQVLWLDAIEKKYIEEVGTMNIMFLIDDVLVTPPLEGSILGGITRDTVLTLAKHWGVNIEERKISIDEVLEKAKSGALQEVFGTGTAAVISPVGWIQHKQEMVTINKGGIGSFSQRLYDEITGIQYGERPDIFGWCYQV